MSADIIRELRQIELDIIKHEKAITALVARRREILEVTGTRRPVNRKPLSVEDVKKIILGEAKKK